MAVQPSDLYFRSIYEFFHLLSLTMACTVLSLFVRLYFLVGGHCYILSENAGDN